MSRGSFLLGRCSDDAESQGTEQQVLAMEKIVTRLKSRHGHYNPDAYPNPGKLSLRSIRRSLDGAS